jgi:hypothetical protein
MRLCSRAEGQEVVVSVWQEDERQSTERELVDEAEKRRPANEVTISENWRSIRHPKAKVTRDQRRIGTERQPGH